MINRTVNTNGHSILKTLSAAVMSEIRQAITEVRDFGSVEIYIQDGHVSQITTRRIRKTTTGHSNGLKK